MPKRDGTEFVDTRRKVRHITAEGVDVEDTTKATPHSTSKDGSILDYRDREPGFPESPEK